MVETARSPPDCRWESRRVRGSASLEVEIVSFASRRVGRMEEVEEGCTGI